MTVTSTPTSPCTRSLMSRSSWLRSLSSSRMVKLMGGCLSGAAPNTCCMLALARTPLISISPLASTAASVMPTAMLAALTSKCPKACLMRPSVTRTLPSTFTLEGVSSGPSGRATVSWASTLPSTLAGVRPVPLKTLKGSRASISSGTATGPSTLALMKPMRARGGSVMSTWKEPLTSRRRPSASASEASGASSSKVCVSTRTSARGASSGGKFSTSAKARLAASRVSETRSALVVAVHTPLASGSEERWNDPPSNEPPTRCWITQSRVRGASTAGHSVLKTAAGIARSCRRDAPSCRQPCR